MSQAEVPAIMQRPTPVDYAGLAETLAALSYQARLELLDILRLPHSVAEIRLTPHRQVAGENPERTVSKQAVQAHVDKLVDAGLVQVENLPKEGRKANRYIVNVQQFWSVAEGLRRLSTRFAGRGGVGAQTGTMVASAVHGEHTGPRLVLVHGVYEGRTYPLPAKASAPWVVGRSRTAHVSLDYDSFVSLEHARIAKGPEGYTVTDTSKNGTHVNWSLLRRDQARVLKGGDVIGVGRSLLTFAPE